MINDIDNIRSILVQVISVDFDLPVSMFPLVISAEFAGTADFSLVLLSIIRLATCGCAYLHRSHPISNNNYEKIKT